MTTTDKHDASSNASDGCVSVEELGDRRLVHVHKGEDVAWDLTMHLEACRDLKRLGAHPDRQMPLFRSN